jgi:phospholipid-translocating ATPase
MNMNDPPNKVSNVEQMLNTYIPGIAVLLFVLCLIGAILAGAWQATGQVKNAWYLLPALETPTFNVNNPAYAGFLVFFSHLVLLSLLIPISLYVSIEFVKFFIAEVISSDKEMYAVEDDIPSKARSAGLCEELGQVNYIFSDKTGTLTQNLMEFKKCSIAGIEYGQGFCEVERAIARRQGRTLAADPEPPAGMDPGFRFVDNRLLKGAWEKEGQAKIIEGFLMHLALNHTVQVEYKGEMPLFQAESPDEGAFVAAARNLGFSFCRRNMKDIFLRVQDWKSSQVVGSGVERRWTILNVNPFDNNRKRTSVVVEDEAGKKLLLVKGADTSIMPFVDHGQCPFFSETQKHIDKFGDQGLRTLAFAGRELSDADYADWNKRFTQASLLSQGREDALRQAASEIEECHSQPGRQSAIFDSSTPYKSSLVLHGVTALEDKLQENVGNCIAQLAKAMIKIWVLTGPSPPPSPHPVTPPHSTWRPFVRFGQGMRIMMGSWCGSHASARGQSR